MLAVGAAQFSAKVLTTQAAPDDAIIDGIKQVSAKAGIDVSEVGQFIHGTTLATNALIERSGAKAALITRTIDGFEQPIDLKVKLDIHEDHIACDFSGTSGVDKKGINVPLVYTKAYACYALKCCASIRAVPVHVHLPMA